MIEKRILAAVLLVVLAVSGVAAAATMFTAPSGAAYETPSGLIVTAGEEHGSDGSNPFTGTDTVTIGNVTFNASSQANVTADQFEGSWTRLSAIDADGVTVGINPGDKPGVNVSGGVNTLAFADISADDDAEDFNYSATGDTTLRVQTDTSQRVMAVAADGEILDYADSSGSGDVSFELPTGDYDVRVQTADTPTLSNPEPGDGDVVSEFETNLSIDVSDGDFANSNETVDVTFYDGDDESVGTDTLTADGTAITNFTADPGENTWYVQVSDKQNNTLNSSEYTFNAPATLTIRDATDPSTTIDANTTIEFYPQGDLDTVVTREANNGEVDMAGLPADQPLIAVASADGYETRRVFLRSFLESQDIYLLSTDENRVSVEFDLEDFSGDFPNSDTVLIIEREINGSFETVQGDFFGASGRWDAVLIEDKRHRLYLRNVETGTEKPLGQFTPQISGVQTVRVEQEGSVTLSEQTAQILPSPAVGSIQASGDAQFGVSISEGSQEITSWNITVEHVPPDGEETVLATREGSGTGTQDFTLDLKNKTGSVQAQVEYNTSDGSGGLVTISRELREYYPAAEGLLGGLLDIGDGLGAGPEEGSSGTSTMVAWLLSVMATAGAAYGSRGSSEATGLAALGSLSFFTIIGWLSTNVLFAAAATFAAMMLMRQRV